MSYRPQLIAIISIAQQARPNVTGQMADRRAHCTIFSTVVVRTGISRSDIPFLAPVEGAPAPHIHVPGRQQRKERHDLPEAEEAEVAEGNRPGIKEGHLDIKEEEDHRHEVELDRLALARVADGGHAALVRRALLGRRLARAKKL